MSTLRASVNDYLAMRRAMGFKVEGLGKLLGNFVAFCETHGATRVRNDLAMEWATRTIKVGVSDALVARRMDAVRIFARYQQALARAAPVAAARSRHCASRRDPDLAPSRPAPPRYERAQTLSDREPQDRPQPRLLAAAHLQR